MLRLRHRGMRCAKAYLCALLLFTNGCAKFEYIPDIRPIPAHPIIDAIAEFHHFYPVPALISGKEGFGLTGPDAKHIAPQVLTDQVENEFLDAFDQAGVFSRISKFDRHPDFILTGRINALHEHYRPQIWTKLPYIGRVADFLDVKTHITSGEADLTLFVLTRSGRLVGKYRGESSFKESFNPTGEVAPGDRLNLALTEAVQQIQEKILHDAHLRDIALR